MRSSWFLQIAVVLLAPPAWYAWRHHDDLRRALTGAALVLTGMYAGFFGMFAIGETFADPGGWVALGWTAAWLLPLSVLSLLAWRRPRVAVSVLTGLLLALVGVYAWSATAPHVWSTFQDTHGPVLAMAGFMLAVPMAVLGRCRPRAAGLMLIALTTSSMGLVLTNAAGGPGVPSWSTITILTAPTGVIATLLLIASSMHPTPLRRTPSSHDRWEARDHVRDEGRQSRWGRVS